MTMAPGLDKAKIRDSFAAAATSYDAAAALQRQVGLTLLEKFPVQATDGWVLDLGCGTGFLSRQLATDNPSQPLLAVDIAWPMLQAARANDLNQATEFLCADAEKLPFAANSLQQIYSNLALQWCQDLQALFADGLRILQADGQWVFSTFGPATLRELKAAWKAVDDFVHVNPFYSAAAIEAFAHEAGFESVEIESILYTSCYPSVLALMHELKSLGAHNVNQARNHRPTSRRQLQKMIRHYEAAMQGDIVASYEIIFVRLC